MSNDEQPMFSVAYEGETLKGTRTKFRRLINDIEDALSRATELCDMKPPVVNDGKLSYDSVLEFFRPAYPGNSLLGSHATQLYNQLISVAKDSRYELTAWCSVCGSASTVKVCRDGKHHSSSSKRFVFLIDVASLKKFAQDIAKDKTHPRNFGPSTVSDLKALVEKL